MSNFGFSIPADAKIDGIVVRVERRASTANGIRDDIVEISLPGSSSGQNKATSNFWGTSDTYVSYGSSTDLWGRTSITPDQINSSNFAVRFGVVNLFPNPGIFLTAYIDHIEVIVYYTESGTVTGTVRDAATLAPLAGVSVTSDDGQATTTGPDGTYTLADVTAGTRTITFSAAGYNPQVHIITVPSAGTYTLNVDLAPSVINELAGQQITFVWGDGTDRAERSETGDPVLAQALWTGQDQLVLSEPGLVGLLPTSAGVDLVTLAEPGLVGLLPTPDGVDLVTLAELAGQQVAFVWGDGLDLADRFELGPALLVLSQVTGWVGRFWDEPGLFQLRPALEGADQMELAEPGLLPLLVGPAGVDRQEMVETGPALLVWVGSGGLDGWLWEELLGRLDLRASLVGQDWREFWEPGLLPVRSWLSGSETSERHEPGRLGLLVGLGGENWQVLSEDGVLPARAVLSGTDWREFWEPGLLPLLVRLWGPTTLLERPRAVVVHLGARPVTVLLLEADLVTQLSVTDRPTTTVQLGTDLVTQLSLTDRPTTTVQLVARGR